MKKLFFSFLLISSAVQAKTLTVKIDHIDYGSPNLLMLSDGSVGVLPDSKKSFTFNPDETLEIELDAQHKVKSIRPTSSPAPLEDERDFTSKRINYTPSNLTTMAEATTIFNRMRRNYQNESQCYNRAHIWAYEENRKYGTNMMKVFVFYTKRYIRNYNFYWWFHAIPAVYVNNELITLDRRYARGPLAMKPWTDIFVRSKRACPVITKYSQYSQNQQAEDCYVHYATQYFWQPRDLDNLERNGTVKSEWVPSQVNWAYNEAF